MTIIQGQSDPLVFLVPEEIGTHVLIRGISATLSLDGNLLKEWIYKDGVLSEDISVTIEDEIMLNMTQEESMNFPKGLADLEIKFYVAPDSDNKRGILFSLSIGVAIISRDSSYVFGG